MPAGWFLMPNMLLYPYGFSYAELTEGFGSLLKGERECQPDKILLLVLRSCVYHLSGKLLLN